jgi:hypothetical protein
MENLNVNRLLIWRIHFHQGNALDLLMLRYWRECSHILSSIEKRETKKKKEKKDRAQPRSVRMVSCRFPRGSASDPRVAVS